MLIEFCCPVCCAPLAVKEEVAGGQVNCPKCQKLILIPGESPLQRKDDRAPFEADSQFSGPEVAKAISVSVDPYRRELETKAGLLSDAVDMVKTRNKRIKEIESLILKTQKELWELEVEHDERNDDYIRAQTDRKNLRQKLKELEHSGDQNSEKGEADPEEVARIKEKLGKTEAHAASLEKQMASSLESLAAANARTSELFDHLRKLPVTPDFMKHIDLHMAETHEQIEGAHPDLEQAAEHLRRSRAKLEEAAQFIGLLTGERDRLRVRVEELEQELQKTDASASRSEDQDVMLVELGAERDQLESELKAMREQSELWEEAAKEFREKSAKTETEARKKEASFKKKIDRMQTEFEEQAERLREVLKNQQVLADQSMKMEEQRAELKRKLAEAEDRIEELEDQET